MLLPGRRRHLRIDLAVADVGVAMIADIRGGGCRLLLVSPGERCHPSRSRCAWQACRRPTFAGPTKGETPGRLHKVALLRPGGRLWAAPEGAT